MRPNLTTMLKLLYFVLYLGLLGHYCIPTLALADSKHGQGGSLWPLHTKLAQARWVDLTHSFD